MTATRSLCMDQLPSVDDEAVLRELMEQFHEVAVKRYGIDSEQAEISLQLLKPPSRTS